jgi:hypothetical protein
VVLAFALAVIAIVGGIAVPLRGAEPATEFPVDKLLETIRAQYLFRDKIDWSAAEPELRTRVASAKVDEDRAKAIVALFAKAGDVYSRLEWKGRSYAHSEPLDEATRTRVRALIADAGEQTGLNTALMLDARIAYVLVPTLPAYSREEARGYSVALYERVSRLMDEKPIGWIVDLRRNGGGNPDAMLLGLSPLLGDGAVGGTAGADGQQIETLLLRKGGLYRKDTSGESLVAELGVPLRPADTKTPVAVILGPATRSSGQALALAFKGRQDCLFFGEPTARGATTVTNPFRLSRDGTLRLAVGIMTDRNGVAYPFGLDPERVVEGADNFDLLKQDAKVIAALAWLHR